MNNQPDEFFFEIQPIPDDTILFDQFKEEKIFFSYFQVDQKYYLFFYSPKSIDIDLIDRSIDIFEELNTKQRKIRSMRGFFLYALEIMENGKDLQFLFGKSYSYQPSSYYFEDRIQTLHNKVDSLHQKIIQLEP